MNNLLNTSPEPGATHEEFLKEMKDVLTNGVSDDINSEPELKWLSKIWQELEIDVILGRMKENRFTNGIFINSNSF